MPPVPATDGVKEKSLRLYVNVVDGLTIAFPFGITLTLNVYVPIGPRPILRKFIEKNFKEKLFIN